MGFKSQRMYDSRFALPPVPGHDGDYIPPLKSPNGMRQDEITDHDPRRGKLADKLRARSTTQPQQDRSSTNAVDQEESKDSKIRQRTLPPNAKEMVKPALHKLAHQKHIYVKSEEVLAQSLTTLSQILNQYTVDELDTLLLSCTKQEREILLKSLRRN